MSGFSAAAPGRTMPEAVFSSAKGLTGRHVRDIMNT
jgi:hypothetical protein